MLARAVCWSSRRVRVFADILCGTSRKWRSFLILRWLCRGRRRVSIFLRMFVGYSGRIFGCLFIRMKRGPSCRRPAVRPCSRGSMCRAVEVLGALERLWPVSRYWKEFHLRMPSSLFATGLIAALSRPLGSDGTSGVFPDHKGVVFLRHHDLGRDGVNCSRSRVRHDRNRHFRMRSTVPPPTSFENVYLDAVGWVSSSSAQPSVSVSPCSVRSVGSGSMARRPFQARLTI